MNENLIGLSVSVLLHGALALALLAAPALPTPRQETTVPIALAMFEPVPEPVHAAPPPAAPAPAQPTPPPVRPRPPAEAPPPGAQRTPTKAPPKVAEPAPAPPPEVTKPKPEPKPPKVTPEPKPPVVTKAAPERRVRPAPAPPAAAEPRPEPAVPFEHAVPPDPPLEVAKAAPSAPDPRAIASYAQVLAALIARHRAYPRLAQLRRMQGLVEVQLHIAPDGRLVETLIRRSSGHDVLDRQALKMVRLVRPLPKPPKALTGEEFTVIVPVAFRLDG